MNTHQQPNENAARLGSTDQPQGLASGATHKRARQPLTKEYLQRLLHRNPLFTIRGKVGDFTIDVDRDGKPIVLEKANRREPMTEAQAEQVARFKKAVAFAKKALADRRLGPFYEAAGEFRIIPPFAAAVQDYLRSPEIASIDTAAFQGRRWDSIFIHATERFEFACVRVFIVNDKGRLLEENYAAITPGEAQAVYCLQKGIRPGHTVHISVLAADHGGNKAFKATAKMVDSLTSPPCRTSSL